jgi:hypothetical protein
MMNFLTIFLTTIFMLKQVSNESLFNYIIDKTNVGIDATKPFRPNRIIGSPITASKLQLCLSECSKSDECVAGQFDSFLFQCQMYSAHPLTYDLEMSTNKTLFYKCKLIKNLNQLLKIQL